MKIGLALGGGGITGGAFHAGVISALYSVGGWDARTAEVIIGTSAGSITATSLRVGLPPGDFLKRQTGEAMSPEGTTIIARVGTPNRSFQATSERSLRPANPDLLKAFARSPGSAHLGKIAAAALPEGTVPTDTIEHNMNALCQNDWPQPHPWITALRLSDGERVIFGQPGSEPLPSIGSAVAASCAIPGYFAPVKIDGDRYVDGGMTSACNADALVGQGLDAVIISAPMAVHSGLRFAVDMPWRRVIRRQVDREAAALRADGVDVFLFAPNQRDIEAMGSNPMATGRESSVARTAYQSTTQRIAETGRLMSLLAGDSPR